MNHLMSISGLQLFFESNMIYNTTIGILGGSVKEKKGRHGWRGALLHTSPQDMTLLLSAKHVLFFVSSTGQIFNNVLLYIPKKSQLIPGFFTVAQIPGAYFRISQLSDHPVIESSSNTCAMLLNCVVCALFQKFCSSLIHFTK